MKTPFSEYVPLEIGQEVARNGLVLQSALLDKSGDPSELVGGYTTDERALYLPYHDLLQVDQRKVDIRVGLGRLGLMTMTPDALDDLLVGQRHDYAAELLRYDVRLASRARVLKVSGQLEESDFTRFYPGVDSDWAGEYSDELTSLRGVLQESRLFKQISGMRSLSPVKKSFGRVGPSYIVEVRRHEDALAALRVPQH